MESNSLNKNDITYDYCGIADVSAFYQQRNHSSRVPDFSAFVQSPALATSLTWAKHLWVARAIYNYYKRVNRPLKILEYGCGYGSFGFVKEMVPSTLIGIDYNQSSRDSVLACGYDDYIIGDFMVEDLSDHGPFDVICSLDVYGHIEFRDKDKMLVKLSRLLAEDGLLIDGVETGLFDYFASREKAREFAQVDGHVGIEPFEEITSRYKKVFKHVYGQHRFSINVDSYQIEKAFRLYGDENFKAWAQVFSSFSAEQRKVFDLCQGIMFNKLTEQWAAAYQQYGGFGFIIASRLPLDAPMRFSIERLQQVELQSLLGTLGRESRQVSRASYGLSLYWSTLRGFEIPGAQMFGFESDISMGEVDEFLENRNKTSAPRGSILSSKPALVLRRIAAKLKITR